MNIYKEICYKVENFFIKRMSKIDLDFKVNMDRAIDYRTKKQMTKSNKRKNQNKIAS